MYRAAICDDEPAVLEMITDAVQMVFAQENFQCELYPFSSGIELLEVNDSTPFDILFLDICMPGQDGFAIAKEIRMRSEHAVILFVTSKDELVYDSFQYRPFYFLRKRSEAAFTESLQFVIKRIVLYMERDQSIVLKSGNGIVQSVRLQDIIYLEGNRHNVDYHFSNDEVLSTRQVLSEVETALVPSGFVRIHRSYIVNLQKIRRVSMSKYPTVNLCLNIDLPIGRAYKEQVYKQYLEQMNYRL